MKSMLSKLALASLLAVSAVAGSVSAASATVVRPNVPQAVDPIVTGGANTARAADRSNVQTVQYRDDRRWDRDRRDYRDRRHYRDRNWDRRHHHRRHDRDRYHRGPSVHYGWGPTYRYVEPRRAPRYAPPRARASSAHVNWCYNRYRSYRASDNTFQPYNGPRTQCYSPYI